MGAFETRLAAAYMAERTLADRARRQPPHRATSAELQLMRDMMQGHPAERMSAATWRSLQIRDARRGSYSPMMYAPWHIERTFGELHATLTAHRVNTDAGACRAWAMSTGQLPTDACEVCGKTRPPDSDTHPCSFERACLCWHGKPCGPESDGPDSWERTARILDAAGRGEPCE